MGGMILDSAIRTAWDAYACTHFKLEDTIPTESELAGMQAALQAGQRELCEYVREAAQRALPIMLDRWRVTHEDRAALKTRRLKAELDVIRKQLAMTELQ